MIGQRYYIAEISYSKIKEQQEKYNITELNIFWEKGNPTNMRFFEMYDNDELVSFFRLRNKHGITMVGNVFTFPQHRRKGYSKILHYIIIKIVKGLYPKTEILATQTETDNINNITATRIWGEENRREETNEPNRFGIIDWAYEPPKGFVDYIYYDDLSNIYNRNIDDITELWDDLPLDNLVKLALNPIPRLQHENAPKDVEQELIKKYGIQQYGYGTIPAKVLDIFFLRLLITKDDVFYDLGSGSGLVLIYFSQNTQAKGIGIEIVPDRVVESNKHKDRLKLENIYFKQGNVLDYDISDGNIFFMFNPFTIEILKKVNEKLKKISKQKFIKLAVFGTTCVDFFKSQEWLETIYQTDTTCFGNTEPIFIFGSKK